MAFSKGQTYTQQSIRDFWRLKMGEMGGEKLATQRHGKTFCNIRDILYLNVEKVTHYRNFSKLRVGYTLKG